MNFDIKINFYKQMKKPVNIIFVLLVTGISVVFFMFFMNKVTAPTDDNIIIEVPNN